MCCAEQIDHNVIDNTTKSNTLFARSLVMCGNQHYTDTQTDSTDFRPYSEGEIRRHINVGSLDLFQFFSEKTLRMQKLARTVLKKYLQIDDPGDWQQLTIPTEELGKFLADPQSYAPELVPGLQLDTSAQTAHDMLRSPWNQAVVSMLAAHASECASKQQEYYGCDTQEIDWTRLLSDRVYRILLEVVKTRAGIQDYDYEAQKKASKKRRLREYAFERRVQITTTMIMLTRSLDNDEEHQCWSEILYSLDKLGVDGMSDNEEVLDIQGQQGVVAYEPDFRHHQFSILFDRVDAFPEIATQLFSQVGRKRLPRTHGTEKVKRCPPRNLPPSYYQHEYLERMKKGLTQVLVATAEDRPIPRLPNVNSMLLSSEPQHEIRY